MSAPGPFGRRLLVGPCRGHLEACAETYGQACDLGCLELADAELDLVGDLDTDAELRALLSVALIFAALGAFTLATWAGVGWLLWRVFS